MGDLVHTGTPHQEETVLDVADSLEATYPLVRLPTAERPERALFIGLAAVALPIRELNLGHGVDVAIEVSGSDRGLQDALEAAGLGATVVAAGFYQGGAANVRLGEEFHHDRPSLIASIGAWGAPSATPPVEPAPGDGHRHPAAPYRPGLDRGPAGPPVPVRPGAGRLPLDRRAPPGRGQGRPHLPVTARAR